MPGMGMNLWGVSPLYIMKSILVSRTTLKSTNRGQKGGLEPLKPKRKPNRRTETAYKAELRGEQTTLRCQLGKEDGKCCDL